MSASNPSSSGSGVDLPTLAITAAASATAAYVTSKIWAAGTLGAAATMPVLVALLKEAYSKPATVVTRAVPVRGVVRSSPPADERHDPREPAQPAPPMDPDDGRIAQQGELPGRSRSRSRRAWKTAVVTGLLGFLIAAVVITVPEIIAGGSAAGGGRETTFFGGDDEPAVSEDTTTTTPDEMQTAPDGTTVTVPPAETTTVPPAETTTVPPEETEPALPEEPAPEDEPQESPP